MGLTRDTPAGLVLTPLGEKSLDLVPRWVKSRSRLRVG